MYSYNQFIYARERRRFGRQPLFTDRSKPLFSIQPSRVQRFLYVLRNPVDCATQLSDQKAFSIMETENVSYSQHGMYHYEGGWPKDVNINDEEQTLRHRKKIEREDTWGQQVNDLIRSAIQTAEQNSAVNIYQEFFDDLSPEPATDYRATFESRMLNIFHDPRNPNRMVQTIDWAPSDVNKFMGQHTVLPEILLEATVNEEPSEFESENSFFIWDLENPLRPYMVMECHDMMRLALYCPRDDNFLAGGDCTGKVGVWDSRCGGMPIQSCPLEQAHRESASAVCWVHSKSNAEFYTGSWDGSVKYWDGRDLKEPIQEILLDPDPIDKQTRERAHGVMVLEFEYTIPVRYIIASDQGYIFIGNRKGMTPSETLLANYRVFCGPIRTIERNPFFVKNFLVVGDWCAKVWAEECKGSPTTLLVKKKMEVLCGTWSTTRCSLYVTGNMGGDLDFWDLLLHHREPIFSMDFNMAINSIKFRSDGELVAVGLSNGDIHLLELDETMKRSGPRDKALIAALFEREQLRCKLLEGRVEEIKLKRKTSIWEAEQRALAKEKLDLIADLDLNDPAQFLQMIETDLQFKEALRVFNELTLKVEKKRQEREFIMERTEFEYDDLDSATDHTHAPKPHNQPAHPTVHIAQEKGQKEKKS